MNPNKMLTKFSLFAVLLIFILYAIMEAEESEDDRVIDMQEMLRNVSATHTKLVDEFQKLNEKSDSQAFEFQKLKEESNSQASKFQKLIEESNSQASEFQKLKIESNSQASEFHNLVEESNSQASVCSTQTKLIQHLTTRIDELSTCKSCTTNNLPRDCADLFLAGKSTSGVYRIFPIGWQITTGFEVYCDMETNDGGWTVFQRRGNFGNPEDYFFKTWAQYKNGFGDLNKDFWLGNDKLSVLSTRFGDSPNTYDLRVDLRDELGNKAYAEYNKFTVRDEAGKYKIKFSGYSGTAGDSLDYHNEMKFTTKDQDNDRASYNCAVNTNGAWWFTRCYDSNLNGLFLKPGPTSGRTDGVVWANWKGTQKYSLVFSEMKIRPRHSP